MFNLRYFGGLQLLYGYFVCAVIMAPSPFAVSYFAPNHLSVQFDSMEEQRGGWKGGRGTDGHDV